MGDEMKKIKIEFIQIEIYLFAFTKNQQFKTCQLTFLFFLNLFFVFNNVNH